MTLAQFAGIFALLAVQLRSTDADEATIRGYYEALKDLPFEIVALAAQEMARIGGAADGDNRHWFPKTSEWREAAARVERQRRGVIAEHLRKLHLAGGFLCIGCDDTGWTKTSERFGRCDCQRLRELEVIGRRPLPELPPAPASTIPVDAEAIAHTLASPKGMR